MPFLDHLEELRWRILKALLAIVAGAIAGFVIVYRYRAMEVLLRPLRNAWGDDFRLIYLSPADSFFVTLKLGLILGLLLAFPVVVYQAWAFLSPALEKREKRAIIPALYLGLVLFAAGVAMAYFLALPMTLVFFQGFQSDYLQAQLEVTATLAFVVRLLLAFGVVFELPVVVMVLSALGLVTPRFLRDKRRHAYVIVTIVASFLSPGDVVLVTLMMMGPLILLYEFSILLSASISRKREQADRAGGIGAGGPDRDPPEGAWGIGGSA